jgi:uncharacterized protein YciI
MAYAIIAFDGEDPGAHDRRMAAREAHLAVITDWARDGRLVMGVPILAEDGRGIGSCMVIAAEGPAGLEAYLAAEPFARDGVWARWTAHAFRIAPLPYRRLPQPGAPTPPSRTHTIIVARDGSDGAALDRRMAARDRHFARVRSMAADGTLAFGGAILEAPEGRMIGSIAVTRHATDAAARAWLADDPYVTGDVWRDIALHGTRFAPLPYRALPGGE